MEGNSVFLVVHDTHAQALRRPLCSSAAAGRVAVPGAVVTGVPERRRELRGTRLGFLRPSRAAELVAGAESPRRLLGQARKESAEVGWILKAEVIGDLGDRHRRVPKLTLSLDQQAQMHQIHRGLTRR